MDENKRKALDAALSQIDKQFGKGSIMRMDDSQVIEGIQAVSTGSLGLDIALGIGGLPRVELLKFMGQSHPGKHPCHCPLSRNFKKQEELPLLLMQSMPWTFSMQQSWGLILKSCWYPNQTPENKHWRLQICWCAVAQ